MQNPINQKKNHKTNFQLRFRNKSAIVKQPDATPPDSWVIKPNQTNVVVAYICVHLPLTSSRSNELNQHTHTQDPIPIHRVAYRTHRFPTKRKTNLHWKLNFMFNRIKFENKSTSMSILCLAPDANEFDEKKKQKQKNKHSNIRTKQTLVRYANTSQTCAINNYRINTVRLIRPKKKKKKKKLPNANHDTSLFI